MPWATDPVEAVLLLQRAAIVLLGGYNAAHFGAMWRRMGRQRAVAGEGRPGGTAVEAHHPQHTPDTPTHRSRPTKATASGR